MAETHFHLILDGLLHSASILGALIVILAYIGSSLGARHRSLQQLGFGLALGLFSAASMIWPISLESGYRLDARVVPVVLSAPFFGLPAGLLTFLIAALARAGLGGQGAVAGVSVVVLAFLGSAIVALARGWRPTAESQPAEPMSLVLAGVLAAWATASMALPLVANAGTTRASQPFLSATAAVVAIIPLLTFLAALVLLSEERRRELERSLRETNERLAGIIANVPGVIFRRWFGADGMPRFAMVAGRVGEVLGLRAGDLMNDSNAILGRIVPDDAARIGAAVAAAARDNGAFDEEFRFNHPDGSVRWLHAKTQPRDHAVGGFADGVIMDVTRLRAAEAVAAKAKQRADWLADHDALTGLTDRLALLRRAMQEMQASPEGVALVLLDLAGSKRINERFGHAVGDMRILEATRRVARLLAPGFVARMNGDTFGLLITDGRSDDDIAAFAQRALDALDDAAEIDGATVPLGARCGYAVIEGRDSSIEALVRSAEIALEVAREHEGGLAVRYSSAIEEERLERQQFNDALGAAIEAGELTIVWQPIVRAVDRRLVGREALARWTRRGHGPVSPERFVAAAELIGLWKALDRHVLLAACSQAVERPDFGWVSVNVASSWVNEGDLPAVVAATLAATGLPPERLWLEFTERIVIDEHDLARALIVALRELGVQVAIDDFGAVYSSLAYLHQLPVGKIKLDRGFVQDLEGNKRAREIVDAVLRLCARLEIDVVAEGVETEGQLDWLRAHHCQYIQGYLTGRPGPVN